MLSHAQLVVNATKFAENHKNDQYEKGEAQTFYNEFFEIFEIKRRTVALYEESVKDKFDKNIGFIDLFWKGMFLAEHKSMGKNLYSAKRQAFDYCEHLIEKDKPRYILACDFQNWILFDLEAEQIDKNKKIIKFTKRIEFKLHELPNNIGLFNFILNKDKIEINKDDVSIKASEMMGEIYNKLSKTNYKKRDAGIFLTRLVYCLFADDTGIFNPKTFHNYIKNNTRENGRDVGNTLTEIFQMLNTPDEERQEINIDLEKFPHINGDLFSDPLYIPQFDKSMRDLLLKASTFKWKNVSPAIFGTLFQSVMDSKEIHDQGAHYTSEENILRVIKPLFLDNLKLNLDKIKRIKIKSNRDTKLIKFQNMLSELTFLDPACGAGNFLIITYREIRRLELEIIGILRSEQSITDVSKLSKIKVDHFYGIEKLGFSAKIAETSLWVMDHLMNVELGKKYGEAYANLPLGKSPNIKCTDALGFDWNELLDSKECSYVFGNPPFLGSKIMNPDLKKQFSNLFKDVTGIKLLDYVTGWFIKAIKYVNDDVPIAFVATNSITQGIQAYPIWTFLEKYGFEIIFAYNSFKWNSESKGKAQVTVVILGLGKQSNKTKRLFNINNKGEQFETNPNHISLYLQGLNSKKIIVKGGKICLNNLPKMIIGTRPTDDCNYIFTTEEKNKFIKNNPNSKTIFKKYVGSEELIYNKIRWIIVPENIDLNLLNTLTEINECILEVKKFRLNSIKTGTRDLGKTPKKFEITTIPTSKFLVIPRISSEKYVYVPMAYLNPPIIPSDATYIIENASIELFGLLTSKMHMFWFRNVSGKLETRLRYSVGNVYNTFPIPDDYSSLTPFAQKILDIREQFKSVNLAKMYSPGSMPTDLIKAHEILDNKVDKLYRKEKFKTSQDRIEFMFNEYTKIKRKNTLKL